MRVSRGGIQMRRKMLRRMSMRIQISQQIFPDLKFRLDRALV